MDPGICKALFAMFKRLKHSSLNWCIILRDSSKLYEWVRPLKKRIPYWKEVLLKSVWSEVSLRLHRKCSKDVPINNSLPNQTFTPNA